MANAPEDVTLIDEGLATESVDLNLDDFAETGGGAWPKGWYKAIVIEGYATAKGKIFQTEDTSSKDGTSRNTRICFRVTNGTDERTMQESFNYRTTDFTPERLAYVKELREQYKGQRAQKWEDSSAQRSSLALASIGGFSKALGLSVKLTPAHTIIPSVYVGQELDVYLAVDENGFNVVKHFAKAGEKAKR